MGSATPTLESYARAKKGVYNFAPKLKAGGGQDLNNLEDTISLYIECDQENYHDGDIVGLSISDSKNNYFINFLFPCFIFSIADFFILFI